MCEVRMDSLKSDIERVLSKVPEITEKHSKLNSLSSYIESKMATIVPSKSVVFIGQTKKDILANSKEYLNFAQKELLTNLKPLDKSKHLALNDQFNEVEIGWGYSYYIPGDSAFYKKFLMGVGMMDDFAKMAYVVDHNTKYNSMSARKLIEEVCIGRFDLNLALKLKERIKFSSYYVDENFKITNVYALNLYNSHINDFESFYSTTFKHHSIEDIKKSIETYIDSQLSK
ncbi:hypothetical protein XaC1_422 [Xanthomonas phage XaC1]|nr:hypothetical protein XaC1_422 [Xanthomonas phage XaC1]